MGDTTNGKQMPFMTGAPSINYYMQNALQYPPNTPQMFSFSPDPMHAYHQPMHHHIAYNPNFNPQQAQFPHYEQFHNALPGGYMPQHQNMSEQYGYNNYQGAPTPNPPMPPIPIPQPKPVQPSLGQPQKKERNILTFHTESGDTIDLKKDITQASFKPEVESVPVVETLTKAEIIESPPTVCELPSDKEQHEELPDTTNLPAEEPVEYIIETDAVDDVISEDILTLDEGVEVNSAHQEDSSTPDREECDVNKIPQRPYRYNTKYLLELWKLPACYVKPPRLPSIEGVTLDERNRELENWQGDIVGRIPRHTSSVPVGGSKFRPPHGRPYAPRDHRVINLPQRGNTFRESANSYKPAFKLTAPESEEEQLKRKILSLLNKLTPENFEKIEDRICSMGIHRTEDMMTLCEALFDKATKEKTYAATFAKLCHRLQNKISTQDDDESGKRIFFKGPVIRFCQSLFETPLQDYLKKQEVVLDKEIEDEKDPKCKALLINNKQDRLKAKEDQYYGNMRFIGELIKHDVLKPAIFFHCSKILQTNPTNLSLDCLCELYSTVGDRLDIPTHRTDVDNVFKYIRQESNDPNIEMRIRFKLLDLMERRNRGWKKRDIQEKLQVAPMPLAEIRAQSEKREYELTQRYGKAGGGGGGGYNKQSAPSYQRISTLQKEVHRRTSFDANHLVISNETPQANYFGPPHANANRWAGGSSAGSAVQQQQQNRRYDHSEEGRESNRRDIGGRMDRPPKHRSGLTFRRTDSPILSANPFEAHENLSNNNSGVNTPRESVEYLSGSQSSLSSALVEPSNEDNVPILDRDAVERKAKWALTEYANTSVFDADNYVLHKENQSTFVELVINYALEERKDFPRNKAGELFKRLADENLIDEEAIVLGFKAVIEESEDLIPDIPDFWKYIANILSGFITDASTDLSILTKISCSHDEKGFAKMLSCLFKSAAQRLDPKVVGAIFTASHLSWESLLPNTNIQDFISNEKLEFTIATINVRAHISAEFVRKLRSYASEENNERIFDFLENTEEIHSEGIVKVIADFILSSAIVNNKYTPGVIESRLPILKKYASVYNEKTPDVIDEAFVLALQRLTVDQTIKTDIMHDLQARGFISSSKLSEVNCDSNGYGSTQL